MLLFLMNSLYCGDPQTQELQQEIQSSVTKTMKKTHLQVQALVKEKAAEALEGYKNKADISQFTDSELCSDFLQSFHRLFDDAYKDKGISDSKNKQQLIAQELEPFLENVKQLRVQAMQASVATENQKLVTLEQQIRSFELALTETREAAKKQIDTLEQKIQNLHATSEIAKKRTMTLEQENQSFRIASEAEKKKITTLEQQNRNLQKEIEAEKKKASDSGCCLRKAW